jgi:subtilisin family serine protease
VLNIDAQPQYPAAYQIDNIVSVAYTTATDGLGALSNYGATNVDLAAPGEQIYSTYNTSDSAYFPPTFLTFGGTSYSAAMVSGAFALMAAKFPADTPQQLITRLLATTDPLPSLAGRCVTGGRLNLRNALNPPIRLTPVSGGANGAFTLRLSTGPYRTCVIQRLSSVGATNWLPVFTNTTSSTGTFDFTDTTSALVPGRYYRAVSEL